MTIEEKLKEYILSRYDSLFDFAAHVDVPYSTVYGILKRGVYNSNVGNVLSICAALNISADELSKGNIVPLLRKAPEPSFIDLQSLPRLLTAQNITLTVNGDPLTDAERRRFEYFIVVLNDFIRRERNV